MAFVDSSSAAPLHTGDAGRHAAAANSDATCLLLVLFSKEHLACAICFVSRGSGRSMVVQIGLCKEELEHGLGSSVASGTSVLDSNPTAVLVPASTATDVVGSGACGSAG